MAALDLALFHVPIPKERTFRSKEELTLDYTDTELRARYRFGREGILFLSDLLRDMLTRQTNRNHALSVEQQIMVTLRFLASGIFFQVIGDTLERTFRSKEELTLDYTDTELRARYRFGREGILFLSDLLRDMLTRQTNRNHALSVEQQIMVTLRFLASGSFFQVIGDTLGLDKSTVSRMVDSVLDALCDKRNEFIQWPTNLNQTKAEFYEFAGFPNI
ncbi:HARBI1 [Mytilus edulis]|uniref:HARBI1 n=1 Tax=Mytilus edulis TaxID=6550 RepID=A0A8S3QUV3_MYTED|nr:HARBI1 [Mytilus edulis]